MSYEIIERPAEGMIVTQHPQYGRQLWSRVNMTYKHKDDACAICGRRVGIKAYRPVGNSKNRAVRICRDHEGGK